jgi:hypothetical protein
MSPPRRDGFARRATAPIGGMTTHVDVELRVIPDYPRQAAASDLLRAALADVGLTAVPFETTVVDTQQLAERGFVGSQRS